MRGHNENVSALFIMTGILYQNSRERSEHLIGGGGKEKIVGSTSRERNNRARQG